jgi:putative NADPH-quinone reductase
MQKRMTITMDESVYEGLGQDEKREQEALDWSEALIWDSQGNPSHEAR